MLTRRKRKSVYKWRYQQYTVTVYKWRYMHAKGDEWWKNAE